MKVLRSDTWINNSLTERVNYGWKKTLFSDKFIRQLISWLFRLLKSPAPFFKLQSEVFRCLVLSVSNTIWNRKRNMKSSIFERLTTAFNVIFTWNVFIDYQNPWWLFWLIHQSTYPCSYRVNGLNVFFKNQTVKDTSCY